MLVHICGFKFFPLKDPGSLRQPLKEFCQGLDLRGTILLSEEGVNLYVTGPALDVEKLKRMLFAEMGIPEIRFHITQSEKHAYKRMLVKIKKEIVSMGVSGINVCEQTGPTVSPKELKKWLDEGKDILLLDARNDYEIQTGKFKKAVDLNVSNFRKFAKEAEKLPEEIKEKPLVMYCTGGIRCAKSSAHFIHQLGFKNVFQLDGGILNYFKECGDAHWDGECFVFDWRVGLDGGRNETSTELCFACGWPVQDEHKTGHYVIGEYCPKCYDKETGTRKCLSR